MVLLKDIGLLIIGFALGCLFWFIKTRKENDEKFINTITVDDSKTFRPGMIIKFVDGRNNENHD
jgi:hypothetical protein